MTDRERFIKERNSSRKNIKILKRLLLAAILALVLWTGVSCASFKRSIKSISSDFGGGLDRTVDVYPYTGELINTYSGNIDLQTSEQRVFFDLDGKRVIIYNALVIAEEN